MSTTTAQVTLPSARSIPAPAAPSESASLTDWIAVLASMIGAFMAILNIQITNASLLNIEGGIGTGVDNGAWISTSYLIGEIVVIPLTDYLSRVFSFRRYMLTNSVLFALFSMGCAFTHDLGSMIVMRGLQGFAGGILIPMAFTMVLTKLPKAQQPIGLALFALSVTFAPAIGPTIGGYLTENYGWQTIFFVNTPPSIVMVVALAFTLEKRRCSCPSEGGRLGRHRDHGDRALRSADRARGGQQGRLVRVALHRHLAIVAAVFLIAFIVIELTVQKPLVNLRLLKRRNFGIGVARQCAGRLRAVRQRLHPAPVSRPGAALQRGADRQCAGVDRLTAVAHHPAGAVADEALRSPLYRLRRHQHLRRKLFHEIDAVAGHARATSSCCPNIVRAIGQALVLTPISAITTGGIAPSEAGAASGLSNMLRNLGGAVGTATLGTILTKREQFHSNIIGQSVTLYREEVRQRIE